MIELQRYRGGWFEALTVCRLLWVELGFGLDWYPKFLKAASGLDFSPENIDELGDRFYALMRAYWVREKDDWTREMDIPPARWFLEPFQPRGAQRLLTRQAPVRADAILVL